MDSFINTFDKGMNQDLSPRAVSSDQYLLANDLSLTGEGSYAALKPMVSSKNIWSLYSSSDFSSADDFNESDFSQVINILGIKGCNILNNGLKKKGFAVFVSRASSINVYNNIAKNTSNEDIFEIYFVLLRNNNNFNKAELVFSKTRPVSDGYSLASVDAELSGDGDLDIIYFTNQVDPPMAIKCSLDNFYSGSKFKEEELSLVRFSPVYINNVSVSTGGSLICGSYQFSVRLINSVSGNKTKWSLLTNPIPVFNNIEREDLSNSEIPSSGVGEPSDKEIDVSITSTALSANKYDYYQVAVVKNTTGTGIQKLNAYLLNPVDKSDLETFTYNYKGDESENQISIDDLVIDDAQLENVNSISIKNNFLIGGNTKYFDLNHDNGDIIFSSADTNVQDIPVTETQSGLGDLIGNQDNSYTINSINDFYYFRDEVYRFAIAYHDQYGNWGEPQVFDFSSEGNNNAASGCTDWKFPSLFDEPITSSDAEEIKGLTLDINGIQNHPSWARGFAILRAKRIKDVKTQTPVIPTMYVQPMDADPVYPQLGATEKPEAQPPEAVLGTYMPKNLSHVRVKHCVRGNQHCQWYYDYDDKIEIQDVFGGLSGADIPSSHGATKYIHTIFPPTNIYNSAGNYYEPYIHTPSDKLEVVDIQRLSPSDTIFLPSGAAGRSNNDTADSACDLSFAVDITQNYTRSGSGNPIVTDLSYINDDNKILEYIDIVHGQDKATITSAVPESRTSSFGDHAGLQSEGLNEGTIPVNQRMGVIITDKPLEDVNYQLASDPSSQESSHNSSQGALDLPFSLNKLDIEDTYIPIANIRKGLSDFRYGEKNEEYEFIYTGTYERLSATAVASNTAKSVTIYGGDCSYDLHTFKLSDSHYSIPDNNNYTGTVNGASGVTGLEDFFTERYGNSFLRNDSVSNDNFEIGRPIPTEAYSQYISVLLESEVKAKFSDKSSGQKFKLVGEHTVQSAGSSSDARSPLLYQYNLDLSLNNSNKVFFKNNELETYNNSFKSRLIYSDQRVYQTNEIGFDRFRVGNTYDMDESRGAITKLVNSMDRLYAIQERGMSYVPIQGNIIETADSSSLSIRSADIIGIPQYLSTIHGTRYFRSISETSDGFYLADTTNKKIIKVSNGSVIDVSSIGMSSYFSDKFYSYFSPIPNLFGYYDVNNKEYHLLSGESKPNEGNSWGVYFSEKSNSWVSQISTGNRYNIMNGTFFHGESFLFGKFGEVDSIGIHFMNRTVGNKNVLTYLGVDQEPYVDLYVNPVVGIPKVFDVFDVDSEYRLKSIEAKTYDTILSKTQTFTADILDDSQREGTYRVPLPRSNSNQSRLRGTYAKVRLLFQEGSDSPVNYRPELFSLRSNYRISERRY